jgi:hypothetical protein
MLLRLWGEMILAPALRRWRRWRPFERQVPIDANRPE